MANQKGGRVIATRMEPDYRLLTRPNKIAKARYFDGTLEGAIDMAQFISREQGVPIQSIRLLRAQTSTVKILDRPTREVNGPLHYELMYMNNGEYEYLVQIDVYPATFVSAGNWFVTDSLFGQEMNEEEMMRQWDEHPDQPPRIPERIPTGNAKGRVIFPTD